MKAKILVVDDEAVLRENLVRILEGSGYQVSLAEDGATARKAFAQLQPDIVLLDLKLPDANGLDLLPEIKNGNHPAASGRNSIPSTTPSGLLAVTRSGCATCATA